MSDLIALVSYTEFFVPEIFLPNGIAGDLRSKGPRFDPPSGFLKSGGKNFYRGRILIYSFPEPLGFKYHGLDSPVLGWVATFCENPFWRGVPMQDFKVTLKSLDKSPNLISSYHLQKKIPQSQNFTILDYVYSPKKNKNMMKFFTWYKQLNNTISELTNLGSIEG